MRFAVTFTQYSVDEVKAELQKSRPEGRLILVKGSNSTRLYQLPEFLQRYLRYWPSADALLRSDMLMQSMAGPSLAPGIDLQPMPCCARTCSCKAWQVSRLHQVFTNLNGIQGSTLANLVAREPERQSVVISQVLAYTTHEDIVLAGGI